MELGGDPYRGTVVTDLVGNGIPDLAVPNERTVGVRPGLTGRELGPLEQLGVAVAVQGEDRVVVLLSRSS